MSRLLSHLWYNDSFLDKTYCVFWIDENDGKEFGKDNVLEIWWSEFAKNIFEWKKKWAWSVEFNKNIQQKKKKIIEFYASEWVLFCPYCWINQYQKVPKIQSWTEVQSFELDHFLDKWSYPQYACSLYNLIPVCMYCNQRLKHINSITDTKYDEKDFFHIIFGWLRRNDIDKKFKQIETKNFDEAVATKIEENYFFDQFHWLPEMNDGHIKFFRLNHIYRQSPIITNELKYIRSKTKNIKNSWDDIKSIWLDPINMFFWHYPNTQDDILRHCAWKLKKDVIWEIAKKFIEPDNPSSS